jgi:hypothetical protein
MRGKSCHTGCHIRQNSISDARWRILHTVLGYAAVYLGDMTCIHELWVPTTCVVHHAAHAAAEADLGVDTNWRVARREKWSACLVAVYKNLAVAHRVAWPTCLAGTASHAAPPVVCEVHIDSDMPAFRIASQAREKEQECRT